MSAYSTWRIDLYWKKLDLVAVTQKQKVELSCQPKFELITKQFNESLIEIRLDILKKLKEMANLGRTFLLDLKTKTRT